MRTQDSGVIIPSAEDKRRSFGEKYKAADFAECYAKKHASTLSRRFSSFLERKMTRRALMRIQHHQPFESVLDCPSGTGRFFRTLARFNVSVIAMDASGHMLRERRGEYGVFADAPTPVVGSVLQLPLRDSAVDVVLCARWLHHIPEQDARLTILTELARVARVGVMTSFFDANLYRACKRRRNGKISGRHALSRKACTDEALAAGLRPIGMNALFRFHTRITAAAFLSD